MFTSPVISIKNIGKKYHLGFNHEGIGYKTIRDTIANGLKRIVKRPTPILVNKSMDNILLNNSITKSSDNSKEFWALKNISFDVKQGEVVGIIGRNGAGKSTLLKILSEITEPTEGEIRIRGRVVSLLEVGTGFHKELSGRENIYMNGAILGMTRTEIRAKFDEIVAFAEVEKFIDTPVKRYSSGMYVRLAFSVAAHLEPRILLVDEVLSVGDVVFQKKCLGKMEKVAGEGRTILFVSHNMGQISKLCSRVISLNDGRVQADGDPENVIKEYIYSRVSLLKNKKIEGVNILESNYVNLQSFSIYGEDVDTLPRTGKPLNIELLFNFKRPILSPGVRLFVRTLQGIDLLYLTSTPLGRLVVDKAEGKIRFKLTIDELLLTSGQYILAVGVNRVGQVDYLIPNEICQFEVEPDDYYAVGIHLFNTKVGVMAAKHHWSFKKED